MCGIAGYINIGGEKSSPIILKKMIDFLSHRGPDSNGLFFENNYGLCHSRLKIIDHSDAGSQPMVSLDGRYVLVYNGEIYNYLEIKKELIQKGYIFKSTTDSEVLLYGFAEWGEEVVARLNGMFSFSILDKKNKTLFLARDRYGIKPLYYFSNNKAFIFASEIKSILSHPSAGSATINESGLMEYFTFQNFISEQTLFKGVKLFPPGSFSWIYLDGDRTEPIALKTKKYWDFKFREHDQNNLTMADAVSQLQPLFEKAVKRQLVGEVKFGAYLSGGIDSGSIATFASKHFNDFYTYTCGFNVSKSGEEDLIFDERKDAELIASHLNSRHYEVVVKPSDLFKVLEDLSFAVEEPRVGQSYPNFCLANLASKFSRVVFSGAGGDELFGGYPWRYETLRKDNYSEAEESYYQYWQRLVPDHMKQEFFSPIWNNVKEYNTRDLFIQQFNPEKRNSQNFHEWINMALSFEAKTFLQGLLIVEDKISMAHSIETRVPFLDNDLVDFALSLPVSFKIGNADTLKTMTPNLSKDKPIVSGKNILRTLLSKYVPPEIAYRKKQGFSAPDATWFRKECLREIEETLLNKEANIYSIVNFNYAKKTIEDHKQDKGNQRLMIWSLLYLEKLTKTFF